MKQLFKYILLIMVPLSMTSCYYDEIYVPEIPDTVEFATDIQPIIAAKNCSTSGCHDGSIDPDLRMGNEYNSLVPEYVVAGDADNSLFYNQLVNNHGGGASSSELALIKEWINSGALNN